MIDAPRLPRWVPPPLRRPAAFAWSVAGTLHERRALTAAAAMTFYAFMSLVPLLVLLGMVLSALALEDGTATVLGPLMDLMAPAVARFVADQLDTLAHKDTSAIGPVSFIGFLWTSSSCAQASMDAIEEMSGYPRRSWLRQTMAAVAWTVASVLALGAFTWAVFRAHEVIALSAVTAGRLSRSEWLRHLLHTSVSRAESAGLLVAVVALGVATLASFYAVAVARPEGEPRPIWRGAVAAMALWVALSWVFATYVTHLGKYDLYYGSLAALAMLGFWLYLTFACVLAGAEINLTLARLPR